MVVLRHRSLQPGDQNCEKLGIAMDHWQRERGFVEHQYVVWRIEAELAAEVLPEHRLVCSAPDELESPRPHRRHGSALREICYSGKDDIGEQCWRRTIGEQPLEA